MAKPPMVVPDQDDETRDLAADAFGLRLAYGARAVAVLATNCVAQKPGEDRMRPSRGIPWSDLFGKGATVIGIQTAITRQVSGVSGVERVASCSVTAPAPGSSQAIAELSLETAEGSVTVQVGL